MGPRTFVTCLICGREFGSNSINLHEPKCLQRQTETGKTDVSTWTCEKCDTTLPVIRQADHSSTCSATRPTTSTLERSTLEEATDESEKIQRPQTKTLKKPTPNLTHPVIEDVAANTTKKTKNQENSKQKPKRKYTYYRNRKAAATKRTTEEVTKAIPPPCNSCNRCVAPERLHSHVPHVNVTKVNIMAKNNENCNEAAKTKPKSKADDTPGTVADSSGGSKGPRALICYICGRPFGSKSLPLHEPHCLERWKRENDLLPSSQRRAVPQKPENVTSMTRDEFNDAAWQSFQANLVPCSNCGRTFFPERLIVHQRVCKETPNNRSNNNKVTTSNNNHLAPQSPINDNDIQFVQSEVSRVTAAKIPLGTCYICGRLFGSKSIAIHEPQCLKKWRIENEKLPHNLKRPEPEKPALVLNEDGTLDMDAMMDAAWQSHLQQLVPCPRCSRTFYPDRLLVHERSCKGKKNGSETKN